MRLLILLALLIAAPAVAQTVDRNPAILVKTQPPGTANNTAASTAFVATAIGSGGTVQSGGTITGALQITPAGSPAIVDLHTAIPANGVYLSGSGAYLDVCNPTGCIAGPHILAQQANLLTTRTDNAQEVNAEFNAVIQTGKAVNWRPSTAFLAGDLVLTNNTGFFGSLYRAAANCTSASSGVGPSGTGTGITDGTCSWSWYTDGLNGGKSNLSVSTQVKPGGASAWGLVTDFQVEAGVGNTNNFGAEFDCQNNNADSFPGSSFGFTCLFFGGQNSGSFPMMTYQLFSNSNPSNFGAHYGFLFNNAKVVKDAIIGDVSTATYGYQNLGAKSTAIIREEANSYSIMSILGAHSYGLDLGSASFASGTAINLPNGSFIGFNGTADLLGHNGSINALTFGSTNSGTAFAFAAYDNQDFATGRHLFANPAAGTPALSGCGTSPALQANSTDTHGTITVGAGGTGCVLTFANAYAAMPDCTLTAWNHGAPADMSLSTAQLAISAAAGAGNKYTYICMGH